MKAMVSVGEAHISSMVAAYEVGTLTSKTRPVASLRASAMTSPPVVMIWASTEGTNNTLIGCSSVPMPMLGSSVGSAVGSGASVGSAVGSGTSVGSGASVGSTAAVVAVGSAAGVVGAQAATRMEMSAKTLSN